MTRICFLSGSEILEEPWAPFKLDFFFFPMSSLDFNGDNPKSVCCDVALVGGVFITCRAISLGWPQMSDRFAKR